MSDLRDLYQEVILDHNKNPRNFREIEGAQRAEGYNPLCGDRVTVYLKTHDGVIEEVSFIGKGCAISTASASLMTEAVLGRTVDEARSLFEGFHRLVTEGKESASQGPDLGKLAVFSGVSEFPARVKCASLVWHTLRTALDSPGATVSTE
jgi:nitrogen fixation NifU-like protein